MRGLRWAERALLRRTEGMYAGAAVAVGEGVPSEAEDMLSLRIGVSRRDSVGWGSGWELSRGAELRLVVVEGGGSGGGK